MTLSVLMATYAMEQPQYLDAAMASIWTKQMRRPDQIVLVEDGTLPDPLEAVVVKWEKEIGSILEVIRVSEHRGLAACLNDGISRCKGDLIARMDSDDMSSPDRFSKQVAYLMEHPEVDILGGGLMEVNDEGTVLFVRQYPASPERVMSTIHRASPLGHPSVVFRRRVFDSGLSYKNKYNCCEDISLWFDALKNGFVITNMKDVVLLFRRNNTMVHRRNHQKAWGEFHAYNEGIRSLFGVWTLRYAFSVYRLCFRLLPNFLIARIYNNSIRNKIAR